MQAQRTVIATVEPQPNSTLNSESSVLYSLLQHRAGQVFAAELIVFAFRSQVRAGGALSIESGEHAYKILAALISTRTRAAALRSLVRAIFLTPAAVCKLKALARFYLSGHIRQRCTHTHTAY